MANDVIVKKNEAVGIVSTNMELPNFKELNLGDEPRKLKIRVENGTKKDGTKFKKVYGYIICNIYDGIEDEAKFVRRGIKRLSVHFKQVAFKEEKGENINVSDINDLSSGYLFVKAKGLRKPTNYKLRYERDDKGNIVYDDNGEAKIKYPEIWIERGILGFIAVVTAQEDLDVDNFNEDVVDAEVKVDAETGEVVEAEDEDIREAITDEPDDAEETEI